MEDNLKLKIIKETVGKNLSIDLDSNTKKREKTDALHIYFSISKELTKLSLAEIGKSVNRNHCTVLYGVNTCKERADLYIDYKDKHTLCLNESKRNLGTFSSLEFKYPTTRIWSIGMMHYDFSILDILEKKGIAMLYSLIDDVEGRKIFDGDILIDRVEDVEAPNGSYHESFLPVFFENGAFWVDESFHKDRSFATLLNEWENPKVVGNIFENPELLINEAN